MYRMSFTKPEWSPTLPLRGIQRTHGRVSILVAVLALFASQAAAVSLKPVSSESGSAAADKSAGHAAAGSSPRVANDDCVDAIMLFGDGTFAFSTIGATTDGPAHPGCTVDQGQAYNDIWYAYFATCTGTLTVSTCNDADFDTVLVVYDGCDCGNLSLLGCNDDAPSCAGNTSEVMVSVIRDNCYLIRVGSYRAGDSGAGNLTLTCTHQTGACCTRADVTCVPGACGRIEPCGDDPANCQCFPTAEGGTRCSFTSACPNLTPCPNGTADCAEGEYCQVDTCCSGPVCDTEGGCWFGALEDGGVHDGQSAGPAAWNDAGAVLTPQLGEHCVLVDWVTCEAMGGVYQGDLSACNIDPCVPPNDDCADGELILSVPSSTPGTTVLATQDTAPYCGTSVDTPGVWYRVLGTGYTMTASTCNNATYFDTKISVYCNECGTLTCVAGNDDPPGSPAECSLDGLNRKARVSWCSQWGAEYLVLVHGYSGATGDFVLDITDDGVPCGGAVECGGQAIGACCASTAPCEQGIACGGPVISCNGSLGCTCFNTAEGEVRCGPNIQWDGDPCPNGTSDCPPGTACLSDPCGGGNVICWLDHCPVEGVNGAEPPADEFGLVGDPDVERISSSEHRGIRTCDEMPRSICEDFFGGDYRGDGVACGPGVCECLCGDLTGDGEVNLADFVTFAGCFGLTGPAPNCTAQEFSCSDLDGDGQVTLADFVTFAGVFGQPASGSPPNCI